MRPLFVAGCPRSGTSAFTRYLNRHPWILITVERYNYNMSITPDLFTPERLLDFRPGETTRPKEATRTLLESKRWEDLLWVGDKRPRYFLRYEDILERNPQAHFFFIYRSVEEVAESFQERANRPKGWRLTFEDGVRMWNNSLRHTRNFACLGAPLCVVDYHSFFSEPATWVPLLSDFLGLDFAPETVQAWERRGIDYAKERRVKEPLSEEQETYIREHKSKELENWVHRYIKTQFLSLTEQSSP